MSSAENTRSSEPPITTDLFQGAVLADNRFSRFDDELIDKYFNDDGKAAIEAYIASKVEEAYRKGYAAGNAKKNYHKKGDASQIIKGLEIRVSALEHRLAALKETTNSAIQEDEEKDAQS